MLNDNRDYFPLNLSMQRFFILLITANPRFISIEFTGDFDSDFVFVCERVCIVWLW